MSTYLVRRLLQAIPVVIGVSILIFGVLHLIPGDPVELVTRDSAGLSVEAKDQLRERLGFNDPLPVQYFRFLLNAVQGDFGRSLISNRAVSEIMLNALVPTAQLAVAALVIGAIGGVSLGVLAAVRPGSVLDVVTMAVALLGISVPGFFLGLVLIFIFALGLGWFPILSGTGLPGLVLPATTLALFAVGMNARLVRSSMIEVMQQEYILTARAKGLPRRLVVFRHALRNALLPAVTMMGLQVGMFLSGSVIVETVFTRVGLGRALAEAVLNKDIPVVQGILFIAVLGYVGAQLLVDISYAWLDPRIRLS